MISRRQFVGGLATAVAHRAFASPPMVLRPLGANAADGAEATASRHIATPDRGAASMVLSLGLCPVASVGSDFYNEMGASPPMPAGVVDCGDPVEPNLELLRELDVSQIVTVTTDPPIITVLEQVAPVTALDIYTGRPGALDRGAAELRRLGGVLGVVDRADAYVRHVEAVIETTREAIKGKTARPVYLVTVDAGGRSMVVYGANSIMHDVMLRLGVQNAWTGPTGAYGFQNTGVETLAQVPDAMIFYVDYGVTTRAALAGLARSPFWTHLPSVRAGRVARLPLFDVYNAYPVAPVFARYLGAALQTVPA